MKVFFILSLAVLVSCKSMTTQKFIETPVSPEITMEEINDEAVKQKSFPDLAKTVNSFVSPSYETCKIESAVDYTDLEKSHEAVFNAPIVTPSVLQEDGLSSEISETTSAPQTIARTGKCISFNLNEYNKSNSGANMLGRIKLAPNNKEAFIKEYGPLAIYIQSKTNYPASALLAQWSDETGWGTSKQIRVNNNIGGHSCFKENPAYKYPSIQEKDLPSYFKNKINVKCTYKRPAAEGGYYMTFANIVEASLSQVYNILDNPKTQRSYKATRTVFTEAIARGEKPNPFKIIDGLAGYAAFPKEYRDRIKARIKKENFERFDNMGICDEQKK